MKSNISTKSLYGCLSTSICCCFLRHSTLCFETLFSRRETRLVVAKRPNTAASIITSTLIISSSASCMPVMLLRVSLNAALSFQVEALCGEKGGGSVTDDCLVDNGVDESVDTVHRGGDFHHWAVGGVSDCAARLTKKSATTRSVVWAMEAGRMPMCAR